MEPYQGQQAEIYRLVRENNKMLHSMRRNAFWGGVFKFILYAAFLLAPLWFYFAYLNDTVQQMMKTIEQVQGAGTSAQAQLGSFQELFKQLESKIPSFMRPSTSLDR